MKLYTKKEIENNINNGINAINREISNSSETYGYRTITVSLPYTDWRTCSAIKNHFRSRGWTVHKYRTNSSSVFELSF